MQKFLKISILILSLVFYTAVLAQDSAAKNFKADDPVLITSAGQSADILMAKILAKKASVRYAFNKVASTSDLDTVKSIIIVCGGSTKGLGAAKIDKVEEYQRVEKLIKAARKRSLKIIAVHVGGKSRRGALSDYFNKLVADNADHLIVVKGGNEDGFFTKIAKEKKIGIDLPEKIVEIQPIFEKIYSTKP